MERLIDVNKVIDSMQKCLDESPDKRHSVAYFAFESIIELLKKTPTVDAVGVVRCRECKHFRHYGKTSLFINGKNIKAGWCQRHIRYDEEYRMTEDDFCSYGERKDGDADA